MLKPNLVMVEWCKGYNPRRIVGLGFRFNDRVAGNVQAYNPETGMVLIFVTDQEVLGQLQKQGVLNERV